MTDDTIMDPQEGSDPDAIFASLDEDGAPVEDIGKPEPETVPIKIGDAEYTSEQLEAAIAEATRAKEIEKGGRQKMEEAAELRKTLESRQEEMGQAWTIWENFTKGTPETQRAILAELHKIAGQEPTAPIRDTGMTQEEWDEANAATNERVLRGQVAVLQANLEHLTKQLQGLAPILSDVRTFTETEKAGRWMQGQLDGLKELGVQATRERIEELQKQGVADPLATYKALQSDFAAVHQAGADKVRGKADEIPKAAQDPNTFDPNDPAYDNDPDKIYRELLAGRNPI